MSLVRELLVRISGDTSGFEKATDRAKNVLTGLTGGIATASKMIGMAFVAAVTSATAAIGFLAKAGLEYGDMTDSLSKQTGLSTEAIGGLKYAAEQSGTAFEAVTSSINIMRRNLADAAINGGPVADTLNRIGLSAKDLARLTPEQQFDRVAGALQEMGSGAVQTNAAFTLFGRGAAGIMPLLQSGTTGIADMRAEAERLGLVLNSTETAALDAAGDSIATLQGSVQGLANKVGAELAPYIQMGAKMFTDYFFVPLQKDIPRLFYAFLDFASGTELAIRQLSVKMGAYFKSVVAGIVENGITELQAFLGWAERQLNKLPFVKTDGKSTAGQGMLDDARKARAEAQSAVDAVNKLGTDDTWAGALKKRAAEMRKEYEKKGKKGKKGKKAAENIAKGGSGELKEATKKETKEVKIIWDDDFQQKWDADLKRAREQYLLTMEPAQRGLERYIDTMKEARKNGEDWANLTQHAMQGLEDAFVKAATTGKLSFKDMFSSISADIARILIRQSVTEPLAQAASGFLKGINKGINWGDIFGSLSGARASGGPVNGGGAYLVGENGPEVFVPSVSGGIVPNNMLDGGGQSVVVQQSLSFGLGVQQGVRQELQAMMPQILAQTRNGVQVAIERGGSMARSVGRRS